MLRDSKRVKKVFKYKIHIVWILPLLSMFADIASEMLYPIIPVYLQSIGFLIFLIVLLEGLVEASSQVGGFQKPRLDLQDFRISI